MALRWSWTPPRFGQEAGLADLVAVYSRATFFPWLCNRNTSKHRLEMRCAGGHGDAVFMQMTNLWDCLKSEEGSWQGWNTMSKSLSSSGAPHIHPCGWDSRSCPGLQMLHSRYCCVFNKGPCKTTTWWRANHTKKPDRFCFCHLQKGT